MFDFFLWYPYDIRTISVQAHYIRYRYLLIGHQQSKYFIPDFVFLRYLSMLRINFEANVAYKYLIKPGAGVAKNDAAPQHSLALIFT
jgi:hypothetical protein